jgi:hypothetical protein
MYRCTLAQSNQDRQTPYLQQNSHSTAHWAAERDRRKAKLKKFIYNMLYRDGIGYRLGLHKVSSLAQLMSKHTSLLHVIVYLIPNVLPHLHLELHPAESMGF